VQLLAAKYGKPMSALRRTRLKRWPRRLAGQCAPALQRGRAGCALATTPLIPLALVQRALRVPAMEALTYAEAKQRFERNYLVQLLKLTDGNVADAARIAERNRTEFYRLLQKHD
jgi:two-component system response regulator GlrR